MENTDMTPQEIFDEVATKLLAQGERCSYIAADGSPGGYAYQNSLGMRCAVGMLMDERELAVYATYDGDISALLAEDGFAKQQVLRPLFYDNMRLLDDLQVAHDHNSDNWMEEWKSRMRKVAANHGLRSAILGEPT